MKEGHRQEDGRADKPQSPQKQLVMDFPLSAVLEISLGVPCRSLKFVEGTTIYSPPLIWKIMRGGGVEEHGGMRREAHVVAIQSA
jgi:hypothetical protein